MLDRREFIGALGAPATAALAVGFIDVVRAREAVAALSGRPGTPEEIGIHPAANALAIAEAMAAVAQKRLPTT